MDRDVSLLLDCAAWHGLRQSQVRVEISERFNRHRDADLERHIDHLWAERLAKEPWLFNGAKFRLHSFQFSSLNTSSSHHFLCSGDSESSHAKSTGARLDNAIVASEKGEGNELQPKESSDDNYRSEEAVPLLTLRLGLTCYKDYLGTNWSLRVDELHKRGESEFGDHLALLAQPLGVGAVMSTSDGKVVLIRRSQKVAEAGGLLDIPGGHPEPKVVLESLGQTVCEESITVTLLQHKPGAVVAELFSSVCAEIRDEVNVPLQFLGEPVLMGVALNHTSAGRPSAEFHVSCSLTSDEVRTLYWQGGAEAHESTDIVFITTGEMLHLDLNIPLWAEMCPSAKGAVLLFQKVRPDRETSARQTSDVQV
ncbi:uridine diphosphate glucose pyrophosphatase NUDT22 [Synchiropus splendidus]|uniref:uridine diphosphate glucose pyrophosphatase NUDT22 n=1 Tax=Synchiropus splendidus TaxID=270530 RepID=UPI00237E10C8|nr:uridine diphosphate glucose pyrophosphatase NUDT22 [Synchiropus splendidus]XP_053735551.1 uridine diphosphate glucose pyrophosphatase NUDT22 [Synchiropus splendidus]